MADRNRQPRVEITGYSLWLRGVSNCNPKKQLAGGLRVAQFAVRDSLDVTGATGSGTGPGKANFDTLQVTVVPESGMEFAQLSRAQHTGANTGTGRLDAVLSTGGMRNLLSFEDSMVSAVTALQSRFDDEQFLVEFSIEQLKILWEPLRQ